MTSSLPLSARVGGKGLRLYLDSCVLIYALEGFGRFRTHTLQQLEQYASDQWVISDLVRMECLVGPLRSDDQLRLLAFRSFFSDCEVLPLTAEVFDLAARWRAEQRLSTADALHLAAALHGGCDALLSNDRAFQLDAPPLTLLRLNQDPKPEL